MTPRDSWPKPRRQTPLSFKGAGGVNPPATTEIGDNQAPARGPLPCSVILPAPSSVPDPSAGCPFSTTDYVGGVPWGPTLQPAYFLATSGRSP